MLSAKILEILNSYEASFKESSNNFFDPVNEKFVPLYLKQGVISIGEDDTKEEPKSHQIFCNVPGCKRYFQSVTAYQSHYNTLHRLICSQCKKSLPTAHLLDLHLSEYHDSYFLVKSQRQPMYECFLEECKHKCENPEERRDHCISTHKFPPNYRFDIVYQYGKRKVTNVADESPMMQDEPKPFAVNKSNNQHFSFGHQATKTFTNKSYAKLLTKSTSSKSNKNSLEDSKTVKDLLDSLPSEIIPSLH